MTVRVRFAPSPTGFLHLGGARTALFNWLHARKNNGTFILRIEDTDEERSTEASTEQILESMKWLGMEWDEGPFFQSKRGDKYREALEKLIREGRAYRAFETPEELDAQREKARAEKRDWVYDRASLRLTKAEIQNNIAAGRPFVWRFLAPEGTTAVPDTLMGGDAGATFDNETVIGDFPLTRAGTEDAWGAPLYNFCCAVDDADMEITHVIRGVEHLPNAARQVLIMEALGHKPPTYTHLPLIMKLDPETKKSKKMSKRDADADPRYPVSVSARRDLGYLPEATRNFIALLGWALDDKTEFFERDALIQGFSLDGLSKSQANFDEDKYLHMNGLWMRHLPAEDLLDRSLPFMEHAGMDVAGSDRPWLMSLITMTRERATLLSDFPNLLDFFFARPESYEPKGAQKILLKDPEGAADLLAAAADRLEGVEDFSHDGLEAALRAFAEERGVGFGKVAQPIRMAVTGRTASPGLFEVLEALGREESAARARETAERLKAGTLVLGED